MKLSKSTIRHWAWFALLAVFFNVVSPTLSHAFVDDPSAEGRGTIAICTSTGMKYVKLDVTSESGSESPSGGQQASAMADCPFCLLAAHLPALHCAPNFALPVAPTSSNCSKAPTDLPDSCELWRQSRSRSPPIPL